MSERGVGKGRVLVLSSANPMVGPGTLAYDYTRALQIDGYEADLLTLNSVDGHSEILSLYRGPYSRFHNLRFKIWEKLRHPDPTGEHRLFYCREEDMPVPMSRFRRAIRKNYDYVLIVFWQEMLTFKTVLLLKELLPGARFIFVCVDFSPATGGCHFIGDCPRYDMGCGLCPMLGGRSLNDATRHNVAYRSEVYSRVDPVLMANTYMLDIFRRSKAVPEATKMVRATLLLDLEQFRELPCNESRRALAIPTGKRFVIFFGSQDMNDKRKGFGLLLKSLALFKQKLTTAEADSVHLLIAGRAIDSIVHELPFSYTYVGYVAPSELPRLYSTANVYLSPSVSDAGPSMVNQSIACGTPVVAFRMGTALDVIDGQGTGVCAPLGDVEAFAAGIDTIYRLSPEEYAAMRALCREVAQNRHSYQAFARDFRSAIGGE
ncbi:MAG: glycosyltransferase [Muribaculum sp.]|nr:glycosyltransferase [Muribaculaceae bacterium]MCM1081260.1 glycosyltransferase [Muribaculum sp.]